ncbi:MAG: DNA-binding protein [uncultured Quadrisphaera sp.]|uniref:DNA-binding protein n=1 Tax=uncultured Quadrisphaera sp. TaxID=904978 RepID=A0A6J4QB78_9ACTN|nr:MAG: DNA-binding protein [uncultured Quadrisphaera sp.]
MAEAALGDFLRARRDALTPEQVGVVSSGARRVAGLRREEVALLARVSVDYYVRLEQGRERNPSAQVLDALGEALRLDEDGRLDLYRLAEQAPRRAWAATREQVDPALLQLMDRWPGTPAVVLGRAYDVLAANPTGDALFGGSVQATNAVVTVFLDPAARTLHVDWPVVAAAAVAGLRLAHGAWPEALRIREVVQQLLRESPEFADLWLTRTAQGEPAEVERFDHPDVGALTLRVHSFDVRSSPGQQLVVHHAEPGSPSADGLALLGSLAATRARAASD